MSLPRYRRPDSENDLDLVSIIMIEAAGSHWLCKQSIERYHWAHSARSYQHAQGSLLA